MFKNAITVYREVDHCKICSFLIGSHTKLSPVCHVEGRGYPLSPLKQKRNESLFNLTLNNFVILYFFLCQIPNKILGETNFNRL